MVLEFVFAAVCTGNTIPYDPCYNSLKAASIQSEFAPKVATAEKVLEKEVYKKTGEEIWIVGGFVGQIYKRQLSYGFDTRNYGIDRTQITLGEHSNGLGLHWNF